MFVRLLFAFLMGIVAYFLLQLFLAEWLSGLIATILGIIVFLRNDPL